MVHGEGDRPDEVRAPSRNCRELSGRGPQIPSISWGIDHFSTKVIKAAKNNHYTGKWARIIDYCPEKQNIGVAACWQE